MMARGKRSWLGHLLACDLSRGELGLHTRIAGDTVVDHRADPPLNLSHR